MRKIWKWLTPVILIVLALVLSITLFLFYVRIIKNREPFDWYNYDVCFNEYNMVFEWELMMLHEGMSLEEICKIIGKPNRLRLGGDTWVEYVCFGGKYLCVNSSGRYKLEERTAPIPEKIATPAKVCLGISSVVVFGGYTVIWLFRKKKAVLQMLPEEAPEPGEAR